MSIPPKTDTRKPISDDGTAVPPKSILPNSTRGVNGVMTNINGRTERRYYPSSNRGFWRPPAAVQDSIARGNKKCRRLS